MRWRQPASRSSGSSPEPPPPRSEPSRTCDDTVVRQALRPDSGSGSPLPIRAAGVLLWSSPGHAASSLRAAWWSLRAARRARRALAAGEFESISLPRVPRLPERAHRGVAAALRDERYTCLERALVRQAWHAAQGDRRDVVIGVRAPSAGFAAHAWLDGDAPCHAEAFAELARKPVAAGRASARVR